MKAVFCDINVDTYIRSLLPCREPSLGLLIGYKEQDATVSVAHALRFKAAATSTIVTNINQLNDMFIAGFGIVGVFAVSPEDPKDVARRLSGIINSSILPRPMLVVHLYTNSSKFTAREVYFDGEEKIRPVDWKECRDMATSPVLLSSSVVLDNLIPAPKSKLASASASARHVAESLPLPTHVVYSRMSFGGFDDAPSSSVALGAVLCQAADTEAVGAGGPDGDADPNTDDTGTYPRLSVEVGYSLATSRAAFTQSRIATASSSGETFMRLSGSVPLIAACWPGDSAGRVVQALGQAMVSAVALLLGSGVSFSSLTGFPGVPIDLPAGLQLWSISSHEGQLVPVLGVCATHPQAEAMRRRLWDVLELRQDSASASATTYFGAAVSRDVSAPRQGEGRLVLVRVGGDAEADKKVDVDAAISAVTAAASHSGKTKAVYSGVTPRSSTEAQVEPTGEDEEEEDYEEDEEGEEGGGGDSDGARKNSINGGSSVSVEISKSKKKRMFMFVLIAFGVLLIFLAIAVKIFVK